MEKLLLPAFSLYAGGVEAFTKIKKLYLKEKFNCLMN